MIPLYHESFPNAPGIYRLTCTITGKFYIGSALNLRRRRNEHYGRLQRNDHWNIKLQAAWKKYGPDAFIFEILELILIPELLTAREQYWFTELRPFGKRGYNIARIAGSPLGVKHTPEAIEKSRQSRIGKKNSEETIRKRALSITGREYTPETRKKIGLASLGRKHTPETRAKMSIAVKAGMVKRKRTMIVTSPEGIEYTIVGVNQFCDEHGLHRSNLIRVAKGKALQHKGWTARYPETNTG